MTGPYLVKIGIDLYMVHREGANTTWLGRRLSSDPWHGITQLAEIYIVVLCLQYLFEFIQTYLMQWVGQKIMFDLRRDIFRHMQQLHVAFFDTHAVGRLVTRLTSDVDAINEMFTGGILAIVDDFFTLTIMSIVMLSINWWLALLAFSVLPIIWFVTRLFRNSCARELSPRARRHRAHQQLHPGTHQRHGGGAVVQPRAARLQRLRSRQPPAHDRVQRHDLRLCAVLPGGRFPLRRLRWRW